MVVGGTQAVVGEEKTAIPDWLHLQISAISLSYFGPTLGYAAPATLPPHQLGGG